MVSTQFEVQTPEEYGPELAWPGTDDLHEARRTIVDLLPPTPVVRAWALERELGCQVYLKLETFQPLNVFKVRGSLNVVRHLAPEERRRGVVCASTGNFGQSIAWAAAQERVPATIFVPVGANPIKVARIRDQQATIREIGRDFDEARVAAEEFAAETGQRYVHSANDAVLVAGAGTHAAELLETVPDLDALYVPIGGGSGAAGACLAKLAARPQPRVIGVQSAQAPVLHETWKRGEPLKTAVMRTRADGLATRQAFRLTMDILRAHLDDFRLVEDDDLTTAAGALLATSRVLAEEAGAAALAGLLAAGRTHAGQKVGVIVSGGNPSADATRAIVEAALRR